MKRILKRFLTCKKRIAAAVVLSAMAAFVLFSSGIINKLFDREGYYDWLKTDPEPRVMIIEVWHIVDFMPYIGSIGTWLKSRADEFAKNRIGIHFNFISLNREQARQRLNRGLTPDIISFSSGSMDHEQLLPLSGIGIDEGSICVESGMMNDMLYSLPFCASGRVLVYDPNLTAGMSESELESSAGTAEAFKKGKADSCICDLKTAGDLYRASLTGNAPYFEAVPYKNDNANELVQFVGISRTIEEHKIGYAEEFIEYITDRKAQDTLCCLGLLPVVINAVADYEQEWITELQKGFDIFSIGNCFYKD